MNIHGFQKMTLLDFPGHVAATVFTGGCNLRCPFCHNALLVTQLDSGAKYDTEEVLSFLEKRTGLLDGVAVTGGEPLLQVDIKSFIKRIKNMGYAVKLDTNGSFPDTLSDLIEEKLIDYVAVDIKNCREKYALTTGIPDYSLEPLDRSLEILKRSGIDHEFRTTVVKEFHTVDDIRKIGEWIKGAPNYYLQNFVDSGNLIGENCSAVAPEMLREMEKIVSNYVQNVKIRGI